MAASVDPESLHKDGDSRSQSGCSVKSGSMCIYRLFYFFYIGAQGAKLIMLPLYLKQLRLPAKYAGLIAGVAPFGAGVGAPLLGYFADSTNTRKSMFLFSLTMLTITPLVCLLPQPTYICEANFLRENSTRRFQETSNFEGKNPVILNNSRDLRGIQTRFVRHYISNTGLIIHGNKTEKIREGWKQHKSQFTESVGMSVDGGTERGEVEDLFIMLLVLLLVGEILSAPAQNLADATTVCALGENHEDYGKIRMFGSVGTVAATIPIVIIARYYQFTVCGEPKDDFEITLYVIAGFSTMSLFIGFWFPVDQPSQFVDQQNRFGDETDKCMDQTKRQKSQLVDQENRFRDQTGKIMDQTKRQKSQFVDQTNRFGDQTNHQTAKRVKNKEWEEEKEPICLKEIICTFRSITFLATVFYLGLCMGVFYTFMFWYLDDIAPAQVPYVVGAAICLRNIGLISAFRVSGTALRQFGSVNVVNGALVIMVPAFMVYGYLENVWIAIIPEVLQNVAYGFGWTGSVAFYSEKYPRNLAATTQGIVEGIYKGFGFGTGPIMAGFLLSSIGGGRTFLLFGGITGVMLVFAIITQLISNALARDSKKYSPLPMDEEEP